MALPMILATVVWWGAMACSPWASMDVMDLGLLSWLWPSQFPSLVTSVTPWWILLVPWVGFLHTMPSAPFTFQFWSCNSRHCQQSLGSFYQQMALQPAAPSWSLQWTWQKPPQDILASSSSNNSHQVWPTSRSLGLDQSCQWTTWWLCFLLLLPVLLGWWVPWLLCWWCQTPSSPWALVQDWEAVPGPTLPGILWEVSLLIWPWSQRMACSDCQCG